MPWVKTVFKRLAGLALTVLAASVVIFLAVSLAPGDPAQIMLGTSAQPDTLAALRRQLGLDQPLVWQYLHWLGGIVTGDLGRSYTYGTPVATLIGQKLLVTLPLTALATALALAIALPLGVWSADRPNGPVDILGQILSQFGIAIPNFWIGLLLILGLALGMGWFPSGGFEGWDTGPSALLSLILPAIALALPQAAVLTRVTRTAVLDITGQDFIRTARAKGLSRQRALWQHVLPNALVPVVTMLGLQIPFLISGAVLVENVFNLPGIGSLAYQALAQRDLIVVQNTVLLFATLTLVSNALVDLAYLALDPRLRSRS
ncbi:ABC transporter permease [Thioclava sp. GXIMD4215]|uniref:ABC transporter permease n=1 Tax=Thioclava sp. GXIMD4215 TaxID=3131928 RepID=UPI00311AF6F4